ncbi:hypothetical protein D7Y11_40985 [Corallococcus sp. AB018]|nr:hypothetical protein D7Y11_40985 [Corallococcus sp. AB018]
MALSTSAYANYNVSVANTGGHAVYALYDVNNGYTNATGWVGDFQFLVPGLGAINLNSVSGWPCSSWAVAITYRSQVFTYYYEGMGGLTVSLDGPGNLSLTAPFGRIVPKLPGQCS